MDEVVQSLHTAFVDGQVAANAHVLQVEIRDSYLKESVLKQRLVELPTGGSVALRDFPGVIRIRKPPSVGVFYIAFDNREHLEMGSATLAATRDTCRGRQLWVVKDVSGSTSAMPRAALKAQAPSATAKQDDSRPSRPAPPTVAPWVRVPYPTQLRRKAAAAAGVVKQFVLPPPQRWVHAAVGVAPGTKGIRGAPPAKRERDADAPDTAAEGEAETPSTANEAADDGTASATLLRVGGTGKLADAHCVVGPAHLPAARAAGDAADVSSRVMGNVGGVGGVCVVASPVVAHYRNNISYSFGYDTVRRVWGVGYAAGAFSDGVGGRVVSVTKAIPCVDIAAAVAAALADGALTAAAATTPPEAVAVAVAMELVLGCFGMWHVGFNPADAAGEDGAVTSAAVDEAVAAAAAAAAGAVRPLGMFANANGAPGAAADADDAEVADDGAPPAAAPAGAAVTCANGAPIASAGGYFRRIVVNIGDDGVSVLVVGAQPRADVAYALSWAAAAALAALPVPTACETAAAAAYPTTPAAPTIAVLRELAAAPRACCALHAPFGTVSAGAPAAAFDAPRRRRLVGVWVQGAGAARHNALVKDPASLLVVPTPAEVTRAADAGALMPCGAGGDPALQQTAAAALRAAVDAAGARVVRSGGTLDGLDGSYVSCLAAFGVPLSPQWEAATMPMLAANAAAAAAPPPPPAPVAAPTPVPGGAAAAAINRSLAALAATMGSATTSSAAAAAATASAAVPGDAVVTHDGPTCYCCESTCTRCSTAAATVSEASRAAEAAASVTIHVRGVRYEVGPFAFFQVNTAAAALLVETVAEFVALPHAAVDAQPVEATATAAETTPAETTAMVPATANGDEAAPARRRVLLDVCCGTGFLGLALARNVDAVVGVDVVDDAIKAARANARANGITNATFVASKAEDATEVILSLARAAVGGAGGMAAAVGTSGDIEIVAVVDPPRAGLHRKVVTWLRMLPASQCRRLVYISCDQRSLVRDGNMLTAAPFKKETPWRISRMEGGGPGVVGVDLFPMTPHYEFVACFVR